MTTTRLVLALSLLLSASCTTPVASTAPDHPNVLFIVVDDLNVALGTYGEYPTAKTPHIDKLAAQGIRFDRAYAQDPVCNPSRSSFLSGLRPASTNVLGNFTNPRGEMPNVVMFPEYFASQGYFTARVGKVAHGRYEDAVTWDISENAWRREHYLPGIDHSEVRDNSWVDGSENGMSRAEVFEPTGRTGGLPLTWRATDEREDETPDGRTTRRVIEILREHVAEKPGQPFFIGAGFHKPHQPWVAPKSFFDQHPINELKMPDEPAEDRDDIPVFALSGYPDDAKHSDEQLRQAAAAYHATITMMDHQVGMLMATLAELELEESTIVVFVSDHGFHLGEHGGLWRKHTQFEESTRVPLIVRRPGEKQPGASTVGLVELVDLYPTLVDLAGLRQPSGLEGTSFHGLLEDPERDWKTAIFSEARRNGAHGRTVRTARFRFSEFTPIEGGGEKEHELYDLEKDPKEYVNLANDAAHGELRNKLAELLKAGWQAAGPESQMITQQRN